MKARLKTITRFSELAIQIATWLLSNLLYDVIKKFFRILSGRVQIESLRGGIDSLRRFFYSVETVDYQWHSFSRPHNDPFQIWKYVGCTYTKVYRVFHIFKFKKMQRDCDAYPEVF